MARTCSYIFISYDSGASVTPAIECPAAWLTTSLLFCLMGDKSLIKYYQTYKICLLLPAGVKGHVTPHGFVCVLKMSLNVWSRLALNKLESAGTAGVSRHTWLDFFFKEVSSLSSPYCLQCLALNFDMTAFPHVPLYSCPIFPENKLLEANCSGF